MSSERPAGHVLRFVAPMRLVDGDLVPVAWITCDDRDQFYPGRRKWAAWRAVGADVGRAALAAGLPRLEAVTVHAFVWRRSADAYDPAVWHGTAQALVDGLADASVLPGSGRTHVDGPHMHHGGVLPPLPGLGVGELVLHLVPAGAPLCAGKESGEGSVQVRRDERGAVVEGPDPRSAGGVDDAG